LILLAQSSEMTVRINYKKQHKQSKKDSCLFPNAAAMVTSKQGGSDAGMGMELQWIYMDLL